MPKSLELRMLARLEVRPGWAQLVGVLETCVCVPAQGRRASRVAHGLSQQATPEPRTAAQKPATYFGSATDSVLPRRLDSVAPMRAHMRISSADTRGAPTCCPLACTECRSLQADSLQLPGLQAATDASLLN